MKPEKFFVRALRALGVAVALACVLAGCGEDKRELRPEVYPAEGHAFMEDPAFKQVLAAQDAERKQILGEREKLIQQFEELERNAGSREGAMKLAKWKRLEEEAQACGRSFESNRVHTMQLMRERMARAERDSERIRRGEAVAAKTISK